MKFTEILDPQRTPDAEFAYLESELRSGAAKVFAVELPDSCEPDHTGFAVCYACGMYRMRFTDEIRYSGADAQFRALCTGEEKRFPTIEEMKEYLRSIRLTDEPKPLPRREMPETEREALTLSDPARRSVRMLDPERLLRDITAVVRGQDSAVSAVVRYACAAAAKSCPLRPCSILIAGETGQGKTLLGKTLAQAMNCQITDRAKHYGTITVQCNELTENHDVSRLTGASPNYVGYGDENLLSPVAENPYQVIVFDEIEKAAPRVLDVLMGVLDCGEIMLSKPIDGRSVLDMRYCFLLFTTNVKLERAQQKPVIGFCSTAPDAKQEPADLSTVYRNALVARGMRREIAARFTDIIRFEKLNEQSLIDIILQAIQSCASEYGFRIGYVCPEIVQALYDQIDADGFGARMVNRAVSGRFDLFFASHEAAGTGSLYDLTGTPEAPVMQRSAEKDVAPCIHSESPPA